MYGRIGMKLAFKKMKYCLLDFESFCAWIICEQIQKEAILPKNLNVCVLCHKHLI